MCLTFSFIDLILTYNRCPGHQWAGQLIKLAVRETPARDCSQWADGKFLFNFFSHCISTSILLAVCMKVVATIHQPSSRLLGYFDHLYIVADGACIYQGPVDSLVPFLQAENLICPNYHNPADFGKLCSPFIFFPDVEVFMIPYGRLCYSSTV